MDRWSNRYLADLSASPFVVVHPVAMRPVTKGSTTRLPGTEATW